MFKRLRILRKQKGLTCEQMAAKLGLQTKAGYNKKEHGHTKFTLQEAKKVSEIFGQSIDDIFFGENVSSKDINGVNHEAQERCPF